LAGTYRNRKQQQIRETTPRVVVAEVIHTMARYRKRPVVIDAVQLTNETPDDEILAFLGDDPFEILGDHELVIHTLEGDMRADAGDWLIRGVKGELYPCKPDIFAATYEPASATPTVSVGTEEVDTK
jgi:hypothetical protein